MVNGQASGQAIRSVNRNSRATPIAPDPADIIYVQIYIDPADNTKFFFWEDVRLAFDNALSIRHEARVVPYVRGSDFNKLKPIRFAAVPGVVLDVVVNGPEEPPSKFAEIEVQARNYPKYDPLSSLGPPIALHSAPGNSRLSAPPLNNKELARKIVQGAIGKIAANVDLYVLHTKGEGAPDDFPAVLECYLNAIRQGGHSSALASVGDIYANGLGIPQDSSRALRWYQLAAQKGNTSVQAMIEQLQLHRPTISALVSTTVAAPVRQLDFPLAEQIVDDSSSRSIPQQIRILDTSNALPLAETASSVAEAPKSIPDSYHITNKITKAQLGDTASQIELGDIYHIGDMYRMGNGVPRDYVKAKDWCLRAAEKGDATAQHMIGELYYRGDGVPQDYSAAMDWFLKAANQGYPLAIRYIGGMYYRGKGVSKDYAISMEWYRKAADEGDPGGQYYLGRMYFSGKGVKADHSKALEWLLKAAGQDLAIAACDIGHLYRSNDCPFKDNSKAIEWFLKAANMDNVEAQYELGFIYRDGRGLAQDYQQAMNWHLKAANQGHTPSKYELGILYRLGDGFFQSHTKAMDWFLEAAADGHAIAHYEVGLLHKRGLGVPQDYSKALEWFLKAENHGHPHAQYSIGILYENGQGVPKDYSKALEWYLKAADKGLPQAQYSVGVFYEEGRSIPKSEPRALEWYLKAASQGLAQAQYSLGLFYAQGRVVLKSHSKALELHLKAADQGFVAAQFLVGDRYESGQGVTQDYPKALEWFLKAAQQGHASSLERAALLYYRQPQAGLQTVKELIQLGVAGAEKAKKK
ncbi:hypothetical protein BGW39_005734 [Mortierella sp. 14UC]|nr:hypothetical protein BGW39_005734 [Mortierella sp. 14UC]